MFTHTGARRRGSGALRAAILFVAACAVLAASGLTRAQQSTPPAGVTITITDELVLPVGDPRIGKAVRDSAGNLISKPGDIIRYTLIAVNGGAEPAYGVEMVDPIPRGTEFVIGSAAGVRMTITYSIDGGNHFQPAPILYDFRNPDGTIEKKHVPPDRYTHVKWLVNEPMGPRSKVIATMRVRVSLPGTTASPVNTGGAR
jgi:uncharacterized repeat protein (TIGR01451 family)